MLKLNMKGILKLNGYTLLEVLISLAIFVSILLPLVTLMATVLNKYSNSDLIVATNLGREEMEKTLNNRTFVDEKNIIKINRVFWNISKRIQEDNGLVSVTIEVSRRSDDKVLASLYVEKYLGQK